MTGSSRRWRVRIVEQGRDGHVVYSEGSRELSFYWEFGGGDVVTTVSVGDAAEWRAQHGWAADRRDEIIARVSAEVIRQKAPTCRAEMDETGQLLHFIAGAAPLTPGGGLALRGVSARDNAPARKAAATEFFWRFNEARARMGTIVLILILIAGGAMLAGRSLFTIRTTGTPSGASARAGDFIATPISRLEPYVPSLDRNHGRDRYSIGLLLLSAFDRGSRRYVPVAQGKTGSDSVNVRISGVVGETVWFDAPGTVVIDARAARVLSPAEAAAAGEPPRPKGAEALAALATADRRLEALLAAPGEDGAPAAPAADRIFNAAFLRAAPHQAPLTLGGGDRLMIFWTQRYREGPLVAARVSASGAVVWRTETELGRLDEALPDPERPALVGARPRVEGKVAEPLLVVFDAETGAAATHSLLVR